MTMLHVLHNNHQETHYDCTMGWRIDHPSRTLIIHKPGGRWHIPLDNVVSIEIEYASTPAPQAKVPAIWDLLTAKNNELNEDLEHFKNWSNTILDRMTEDYDGEEAQEHLIDGWLTDIEQHMHDNDREAWSRFFSGRHTANRQVSQEIWHELTGEGPHG